MNQSRQFIVNASAHDIPLPDGMIHTVVTSPPYYSLRKYQGEQEVDWPPVFYRQMPGIPGTRIKAMRCALGLEPTPEAYIGHLVLCFREVRRVLREDGTCWVVVGDSFASQGGPEPAQTKWQVEGASDGQANGQSRRPTSGLHQGDLMGIPHRLMFALQADGWLCRNDVVWAKVAPMPESVSGTRWERCRVKVKARFTNEHPHPSTTGTWHQTAGYGDISTEWHPCPGCDKCREHGGYVLRRGSWRHTRAHETILMCAKSMGYYADQERVRENFSDERMGNPGIYNARSAEALKSETGRGRTYLNIGQGWNEDGSKSGRNPRSVLTPSPEAYKGAHYAVYPRTLISPLLRATAPTRVCPVCGAPWAPVVERETGWDGSRYGERAVSASGGAISGGTDCSTLGSCHGQAVGKTTVLAHRPTCDHDADPIPGWCLDPYVGSGTTLEVCAELGVNAIGLDISLDYLDEHAKPRIGLTPSGALETLPLFAELET